jgi:transcription termination factor Rho
MDSEENSPPTANETPDNSAESPAKKKQAAKKATRKRAAKKATTKRVAKNDTPSAADEPKIEAPAEVKVAAPRAAPSLQKAKDTQVPLAFSAAPDDEPPPPPPQQDFTDEVGGEGGGPDKSRPPTKSNAGGNAAPKAHPNNRGNAQHNGQDHRPARDPRPDRGDFRDRRGPKPKGGPPPKQGKKPPFAKKDKFQKKDRKQRRPAAANKAADGFFGSTDTFVIEVGELPTLPLLRDPEKMAELAEARGKADGGPVELTRLSTIPLQDLVEIARDEFELELDVAPVRDQVIDKILEAAYEAHRPIIATGVVETTADGYGLIVYEHDSYRVRPINTFIPKALIKLYGIKRGTLIKAQVHPKRRPLPADAVKQIRSEGASLDEDQPIDALSESVEEEIAEEVLAAMFPPSEYMQDFDLDEETCPYVLKILSLMDKAPEENLQVTPFEDLIPYYPTKRILLETEQGVSWDNMAMRTVDLLTPVGLGQRGLIVAPPRTGKTVLQQGIANAVLRNSPEAHLIILLIDERPEEVTDFRRQITRGEVIASTFDESPENHVHCAEMVIEKARRMVEDGRDVIILLDSITRLARAYNALASNSGKILSGGVEANALQKPKRFFGSARNIEEGGSLTIIGTALVETGSRMDEVIFEEFKGTGNMELHLDRQLSDKRIFPAIEMAKSGTRKEELLYHKDEMLKVYGLRRAMKGVPPTDAMEMLITRIKKTPNNLQFLLGINS